MLIKELTALSQAARLKESSRARHEDTTYDIDGCDLWLAQGSSADIVEADVTVTYEATPASHSDHPYGETTAREYHDAEVSIDAVTLRQDTPILDKDENEVGTLKAGTDLMKLSWWDRKWERWIEDQIVNNVEAEPDYPERERYEDR